MAFAPWVKGRSGMTESRETIGRLEIVAFRGLLKCVAERGWHSYDIQQDNHR